MVLQIKIVLVGIEQGLVKHPDPELPDFRLEKICLGYLLLAYLAKYLKLLPKIIAGVIGIEVAVEPGPLQVQLALVFDFVN